MGVDFKPNKNTVKHIDTFNHWCQKVLPLVYDESLSYYELLCKVSEILNRVIENESKLGNDVSALHKAYIQLQDYVNSYFTNLDVQKEINHKLNIMSQDGSLSAVLNPLFSELRAIISTLENRMDGFTNLPNGSTTGDAELADARYGVNGDTYSNVGNHIRSVGEAFNVLLSDLKFIKGSDNLLNESYVNYYNAIITKTGTLSADNRGLRVYVLKLNKGETVTVSVDQNWFYGIQADTDGVTSNNFIETADTSTYFDTSTASAKTVKTITMTHDYLFLCFLPKEANANLSVYSSRIMVNRGSEAKDYSPYNVVISTDVRNERYEQFGLLDMYEQAYIKDCSLVANKIEATDGDAVAHYTGVKLPSKILSVKAKVKFYGNAFSTLIAEPNGLYSVEDVINKSIHINMSKTTCYVGYFDGRKLTNTKVFNYNVDDGVECVVGFDYNKTTKTLTVYLPNGETYTEVNEKYYQCTGCYAIWEHYKGSASNGFSCNHFTKVYAKDEQGNVLCDDFKRANGSVGVAPQGYVYSQFTNLNQTGWTF